MFRLSIVIPLAITVLMAGGCSRHSSNIEAIYVSPDKYKNFSCKQIATEMRRIDRHLEATTVHDRIIQGRVGVEPLCAK